MHLAFSGHVRLKTRSTFLIISMRLIAGIYGDGGGGGGGGGTGAEEGGEGATGGDCAGMRKSVMGHVSRRLGASSATFISLPADSLTESSHSLTRA